MLNLQRVKKTILSNKNFLLLWLAQILTQSAVSIITILVGILSHEGVLSSSSRESAASIGIIINLAMLPGLLFAPIAGVFADWFEKKKIMIFSDLIRFVLLIIFIIFQGWNNLWFSYFLIFVLSIVLQFFIPAEGGLIPRLVGKKHILLANSLFSLTVYTTMAVGVTLSGLILNVFGIKLTFSICGFLFIISSCLLYFVRVDEGSRGKKSLIDILGFISNLIRDTKEGVIYAFKTKILRFALIHLLLLQVVGLVLVTIVFRIGSEIYGVSPRTAGVVVFAPVIIGLLVGVVTLNVFGKYKHRIKLIWIGTVFSCIGFGFMAVISTVDGLLSELFLDKIVATLSLMAIGVAVPFLLIPAQTLIYENTKAGFRGRILGIWVALTSSFASFVAILIGFLTDRVGDISVAIIQIVIADFVYSIILFYLLRKKQL